MYSFSYLEYIHSIWIYIKYLYSLVLPYSLYLLVHVYVVINIYHIKYTYIDKLINIYDLLG